MGTVVESATYPGFEPQVRELVEQHKELVDEPLLLAVYYAPDRSPGDVFLFEVLDGYAGNTIDDDGDILEVLYGPTDSFPLPAARDSRLHLLLTNPDEFRLAAAQKTPRLAEIAGAVKAGRFEVLYGAGTSEQLLGVLR